MVKFLVEECEMDINDQSGILNSSPICEAISDGHFEVVKYFISLGADLKYSGNTLLIAIENDETKIAKYLIDHGADIHHVYKNEDGSPMNALTFADDYHRTEISDYLRKKGVKKDNLVYKKGQKSIAEQVVDFFAKEIGPVRRLSLQQIFSDGKQIPIHVIPPNERHNCWTLFTTGMSGQPMQTPKGSEKYRRGELYIQLPADWKFSDDALGDPNFNWPIHWLRTIARYPHKSDSWLGGPVTFFTPEDFPNPIAPNLPMTCFVLMVDKKFDASVSGDEDKEEIQLYRMLPIYTEERDLEIQDGLEAFFEAFDDHDISKVHEPDRVNSALSNL